MSDNEGRTHKGTTRTTVALNTTRNVLDGERSLQVASTSVHLSVACVKLVLKQLDGDLVADFTLEVGVRCCSGHPCRLHKVFLSSSAMLTFSGVVLLLDGVLQHSCKARQAAEWIRDAKGPVRLVVRAAGG